MEIRVGHLFAAFDAVMSIGRQEMDLATAENVSNFIEEFLELLREFDNQRVEILGNKEVSEEEREGAFVTLMEQKAQVPEFNFKNLRSLRITPEQVSLLKRAGLFADSLQS
jgi:hypothetical protein